jgi:signal peptidase I
MRSPTRRQLALLCGLALVVAGLACYEPFAVHSVSMSPTLSSGDQVLVDKVSVRSRHPERRDLIVFLRPGSPEQMVKRVSAVAGDEVGLEDGRLVVNGEIIVEPFVDLESMDGTYFGPVSVGPGEVFVLGDNRANSIDSRIFGPVPESNITGRIITRLWPLRSIGP